MIGAPMVSAKSNYLSAFNQHYNTSDTKLNTCSTCHASSGGGNLNPYGMSYLINKKDFASIETIDSDKDGFTNIEEIKALTFPGNANDYLQTHSQNTSQTPAAITPNVTQEQPTAEVPVSNLTAENTTTETSLNNTTQEQPATEVPTNNSTQTPKSPGFEAILAVGGFLTVLYLKRK
ncbi:hypothetical protein [uncultured Methanomethylovorans sp.]|uniref:hypothetical protein n=1 Tax=uncultured Methanomethylovorans sp. TaxID=183759 RepID=UPI002AA7DD1C|nr:hypothetical protein [uncultured Methanomethylovorans sp.]